MHFIGIPASRLASSPGHSHFLMLHAKQEGLVCECTCMTPLCVFPRKYRKVTLHSREDCLFLATIFKRKACKYTRMHTLEPYLQSVTNGSTHKTSDLAALYLIKRSFSLRSVTWRCTNTQKLIPEPNI